MTVYINSYTLDCALGKIPAERTEALLEQKRASTLSCHYEHQPIDIPYFLAFSEHFKTIESFALMIEQKILSAIQEANWSNDALFNTPIFIGSTSYTIFLTEQNLTTTPINQLSQNAYNQSYSLNEISDFFKKKYNNTQIFNFGTACTSSANALLYAKKLLELNMIEQAIVVGFECQSLISTYGFHSLELLALDQYAPFTKESSGITLGEGIAVLTLSHRQNQNECITLKGGATECDAYNIVTTEPNGKEIHKVMEAALCDAEIDIHDIKGIKVHATGSPVNDSAEYNAIRKFTTTPPIILLKPYIGHTLGACGTLECALLIEYLKNGYPALPKNYVQKNLLSEHALTQATTLNNGYYLLNYLGFGGNNISLVIGYNA